MHKIIELSDQPQDFKLLGVNFKRTKQEIGSPRRYDLFSAETEQNLVSHAIKSRTGIGPIGRGTFGDPNGYYYLLNLKIAGALATQSKSFNDDASQEITASLSHERPDLAIKNSSRLGLFANVHRPDEVLFSPDNITLSLKGMVPSLMGNSWNEIPAREKFDYWQGSNREPKILTDFSENHSIVGVTFLISIPLNANEISLLLPEANLVEVLEMHQKGIEPKSATCLEFFGSMDRWKFEYIYNLVGICYSRTVTEAAMAHVKKADLLTGVNKDEAINVISGKFQELTSQPDECLSIVFSAPK